MRKYAEEIAEPLKDQLKHCYLSNQEDLYLAIRTHLRCSSEGKWPSCEEFESVGEKLRVQFDLEKMDKRYLQ